MDKKSWGWDCMLDLRESEDRKISAMVCGGVCVAVIGFFLLLSWVFFAFILGLFLHNRALFASMMGLFCWTAQG